MAAAPNPPNGDGAVAGAAALSGGGAAGVVLPAAGADDAGADGVVVGGVAVAPNPANRPPVGAVGTVGSEAVEAGAAAGAGVVLIRRGSAYSQASVTRDYSPRRSRGLHTAEQGRAAR